MLNRTGILKVTVILCFVISKSVFAWNEGGGEQDEVINLKPNLMNGSEVFKVCAACHLSKGWGVSDGSFPQIAGQHRTVLIKQLADIRAKNRDNPTMYPFAIPESIGGVQALADVAAYIEQLPINQENGIGPFNPESQEFVKGKEIYRSKCATCHGDAAEGDGERYIPRLSGQHYEYMLRQVIWIRDGKRRNANPEMEDIIANFSELEMQLVTNYISRLSALYK